jgi:hypothetical protein
MMRIAPRVNASEFALIPICIRNDTEAARTRHRRRTISTSRMLKDAANEGDMMNANWNKEVSAALSCHYRGAVHFQEIF